MTLNSAQQQVSALFQAHGQAAVETALAGWYLNKALSGADQADSQAIIAKALALNCEETNYRLAEFNKWKKNFHEAAQYYKTAFVVNPSNLQRRSDIGEFLLRYATQKDIFDFFSHIHKIDQTDTLAHYIVRFFEYFVWLQKEIVENVGPAINSSNGNRTLIMQLVFWGPRYTHILLDYFLPALCASGNLPAIFKKYKIHFIFCTDQNGEEALKSHPSLNRIRPFVTPYTIVFPKPFMDFIAHYHELFGPGWNIPAGLMTQSGYYSVLELGRRTGSHVLNFSPDHIIPNRFMVELDCLLEQEPPAVTGPGYRLYYNKPILNEIESNYRNTEGAIDISESSMIQLLIRHLPVQNYVDSDQYSNFPIYLCWRVPGEGIIAHVNHFHPWVVKGDCLNSPMELTVDPIDGYFLSRKLDHKESIVFAPTGMITFDLGDNPLLLPVTRNPFSPSKVGQWLSPYLTPLHERYFLRPNYYRSIPGNPSSEFRQTAAQALATVKEIIEYAR